MERIIYPGHWPHKTVDIGANGVTVSANPLGQIYQISASLDAANPYGIMVASPWAQFDHLQRTDPNYVREFRKIPEGLLIKQSPGLGLNINGPKGRVAVRPVRSSAGTHVQFEYKLEDEEREISHYISVQTALKVHDTRLVTHASRVTNTYPGGQWITVELDLAFAVSRAGYGQLTDRGAVKMPDPKNDIRFSRGTNGLGAAVLEVENSSLSGRMLAHVIFYNETTKEYIPVEPSLFPGPLRPQEHPPPPSGERLQQQIYLGPNQTLKLAVSFFPETSSRGQSAISQLLDHGHEIAPDDLFFHEDQDLLETIESRILWANVHYILGCCCVPVTGLKVDGICCVADHFALNLGWPRDNYWQMRLLRSLDSQTLAMLLPNDLDNAKRYDLKIREALNKHLTWLFKIAVTEIEIDGEPRYFWRRSYLINGQPKDGEVFQLDTQCYPFLELCEYYEAYHSDPGTGPFIQHILKTASFKNILQDLLSRRDCATSLFSSDETPADDDLGDYKFHLSSNILLWRTLSKLRDLLSLPQFRPLTPAGANYHCLSSLVEMVKRSILGNFVSSHDYSLPDGQFVMENILAYGFDPSKDLDDPMRFRHYHDGNDMPTLYAQEWGFLKHDDYDEDDPHLARLWENTMVWAFTPGPAEAGCNSGYQGGGAERFHGLGSDHSPGPWTLGFFQEWRFAQMVEDEGREEKAWAQIEGSVQFDGTFSEAVDIDTGVCTSKTWFSWPGAMIAENLIDAVIDQVQPSAPR